MSDNEPGDDHEQGIGREGRSGLSLPRDESGRGPAGSRSRRDAGLYGKLRGATEVNEGVVARWFIPFVLLVVVLFIVIIGMYSTRGNELASWQREVATLRAQVDASSSNDPSARLERIQASVDGLSTRLDSIEEISADMQALQAEVARQNQRIEALNSRMNELQQASTQSGGAQPGSSSSDPSGSQSAGASEQSGDAEWVINLITVSDRASADSVQARLNDMGVESRIEPVTRDGQSLHRVVVPGFESDDEARNAAPDLKDRLELSADPWIARQ